MKITRGAYRVFPELELLATDDERIRLLKHAQKTISRRMVRRPLFWLACLAFGVVNGAVTGSLGVMFPSWFSAMIPPWLARPIVAGVLGGSFGLAFQYLYRKPIQRFMREELVGMGIPVCIPCGYDLRGQTEPRCPECGTAFDRRLLKQ